MNRTPSTASFRTGRFTGSIFSRSSSSRRIIRLGRRDEVVLLSSIAYRERLPDICWVFQFVDDGDCVILNRNHALACSIDQELIAPQAELSRPCDRLQRGGRRQKGPI